MNEFNPKTVAIIDGWTPFGQRLIQKFLRLKVVVKVLGDQDTKKQLKSLLQNVPQEDQWNLVFVDPEGAPSKILFQDADWIIDASEEHPFDAVIYQHPHWVMAEKYSKPPHAIFSSNSIFESLADQTKNMPKIKNRMIRFHPVELPKKEVTMVEMTKGENMPGDDFQAITNFVQEKLDLGIITSATDYPLCANVDIGLMLLALATDIKKSNLHHAWEIDAVWQSVFGFMPLKAIDQADIRRILQVLSINIKYPLLERFADLAKRRLRSHLPESEKSPLPFYKNIGRNDFSCVINKPENVVQIPKNIWMDLDISPDNRSDLLNILNDSHRFSAYARVCFGSLLVYMHTLQNIAPEDINKIFIHRYGWSSGIFDIAAAMGKNTVQSCIQEAGLDYNIPAWLAPKK